jgi:dTDP-4-amino-4,6-dideoxygalactose transaminase
MTPRRQMRIPLIRACPARLSQLQAELAEIEDSGIYSNYGPVNAQFERELTQQIFGGVGACVTVCNATLGLMLALRLATAGRGDASCLALMPAFTFAATAHAALWAGLTPLLCDSDPEDWAASSNAEEALLKAFGRQVSVVVPYATYGTDIDLERYAWLSAHYGVAVVIDAAASLGTIDSRGRAFGAGAPFAVVYSMHATKSFATAEGGVIHSGDETLISSLRAMGNFGLNAGRAAVMPGLNSKLSEIGALMALQKLRSFAGLAKHRAALAARYRAELPEFVFQRTSARRQAMVFMPMLLPGALAAQRGEIIERLAERGIGAATYFSPHLAQQPYFAGVTIGRRLPVADEIARRILTLPIYDALTDADVTTVCDALREVCQEVQEARPA